MSDYWTVFPLEGGRKTSDYWTVFPLAPPHQPFVCPVCGGKGIVPHDFYEIKGQWSHWSSYTNANPQTCRGCGGTGVVIR